jgi:hypothetical protein
VKGGLLLETEILTVSQLEPLCRRRSLRTPAAPRPYAFNREAISEA